MYINQAKNRQNKRSFFIADMYLSGLEIWDVEAYVEPQFLIMPIQTLINGDDFKSHGLTILIISIFLLFQHKIEDE